MTFWIVSGLAALGAALLIGWSLLRPRTTAEEAAEQVDIRVYKDQLDSVEKDLARNVVTAEEAERLRTEIKRRILDADRSRSADATRAPRPLSVAAAALAGLGVIGGSYLLYDAVGAPGYEDMPLKKRIADAQAAREGRPSQAELEAKIPPSPEPELDADYADLIAQLRQAVQDRPEDLEGWRLLARNEAGLGNMVAAHAAQSQVIALKGEEAAARDYTTLAAMLVQSAGGTVSAEADRAISGALERDPRDQLALYFAGLMHLQTGRPDLTFRLWEPMLKTSPADAPWMPIIRARLEGVAALAGIDYALPASAAMPNPHGGAGGDGLAAVADMEPEARQAFLEAFVDDLGRRMAARGGPPPDWASLIRAHGLLGNTDQAAAIWAEAQGRFTDPDAIAPIRAAAEQAGVEAVDAEGRGPTREDMEAAAEMDAEDREEMIRNMVDQLGERLATEGGPPQDWARMISSLGVLGDSARAAAIWEEAQQRFPDPEHLAVVREAAVAVGLVE